MFAGMERSAKPVRAVLADDHHFFREGLRGMLESAGVEVVGEATDGEQAVALAHELSPDVAVIDLHMPGLSGTEAVAAIAGQDSNVQVIVLTVSAEERDVLDALAAGACGYLLKETPVPELVASVRLAAAGHAVLSRTVVRALAARAAASGERARARAPLPPLTVREVAVIRLISDGADNATIGRELSISRHTVKQHVTNIFDKLGVQSRVQAAVYAVRSGLV
jgi:DNA-binding NarL/FixJ family response regulator